MPSYLMASSPARCTNRRVVIPPGSLIRWRAFTYRSVVCFVAPQLQYGTGVLCHRARFSAHWPWRKGSESIYSARFCFLGLCIMHIWSWKYGVSLQIWSSVNKWTEFHEFLLLSVQLKFLSAAEALWCLELIGWLTGGYYCYSVTLFRQTISQEVQQHALKLQLCTYMGYEKQFLSWAEDLRVLRTSLVEPGEVV